MGYRERPFRLLNEEGSSDGKEAPKHNSEHRCTVEHSLVSLELIVARVCGRKRYAERRSCVTRSPALVGAESTSGSSLGGVNILEVATNLGGSGSFIKKIQRNAGNGGRPYRRLTTAS